MVLNIVQECYCFLLSRAAIAEAASRAAVAEAAGTRGAPLAPATAAGPACSDGCRTTTRLHAALCQGPVETALLPGSPGLAAMGAEAVAAVLTQVG